MGPRIGGSTSSGRTTPWTPLGNHLSSPIDLFAPFELDPDHGDPSRGDGAEATHTWTTVEGRLERERHQELDFLWSHSRRLGDDRDRRCREIREDFHGHLTDPE